MKTALVLGGSGFLGSHVTKKLVASGRQVRILVRSSSDTSATDHLNIERVLGDVADQSSLERAMAACSDVYYCIVDTRAWLRDPTPLFTTNIDGLRKAMEAALSQRVDRFVYTSTYATIGLNPSGVSSEADKVKDLAEQPAYVRCRVQAEELFFDYCRDRGLPGTACCVGNTYGEGDIQPTPHGNLIKQVALGRIPCYWDGGGPALNILDAAEGLIAAAERGRIGERYLIAGPDLDYKTLFTVAAKAAGRKPPSWYLPPWALRSISRTSEAITRMIRLDNQLSAESIALATQLPTVSCAKAKLELGWEAGDPRDAVREAAIWYLAHR